MTNYCLSIKLIRLEWALEIVDGKFAAFTFQTLRCIPRKTRIP